MYIKVLIVSFLAVMGFAEEKPYSLYSPLPTMDGNETAELTIKMPNGEKKKLPFPKGAGLSLEQKDFLVVGFIDHQIGAIFTNGFDFVDLKTAETRPILRDVVQVIDKCPHNVLIAVRKLKTKVLVRINLNEKVSEKEAVTLAKGEWLPDSTDEDLGVAKSVIRKRAQTVKCKDSQLIVTEPGKKSVSYDLHIK